MQEKDLPEYILQTDDLTPDEQLCRPSLEGLHGGLTHYWVRDADISALIYSQDFEPSIYIHDNVIHERLGCLRCGDKRIMAWEASGFDPCCPGRPMFVRYEVDGCRKSVDDVRQQCASSLENDTSEEAHEEFYHPIEDVELDLSQYTLQSLEFRGLIAPETLDLWRRLGVPLDIPYEQAVMAEWDAMLPDFHDPEVYFGGQIKLA